MSENEDLYGKVREALTLSRKDSVKAKQFETEVENLKDEFDRLRMAYDGTREYIENIEVIFLHVISYVIMCLHSQKRIKPEEKDQSELLRISNETSALKAELVKLKANLAKKSCEKTGSFEEGEVLQRLQEQQEEIGELREMVKYQVRTGHKFDLVIARSTSINNFLFCFTLIKLVPLKGFSPGRSSEGN